MPDREFIPLPTPEEKDRAVAAILSSGLYRRPTLWSQLGQMARALPLNVLFFGVGDCLFLSCLLTGLCLVPAARAAGGSSSLAPLLFLFSPVLYACLHLLTQWKEAMSGTLAWKRTCRLSFAALTAWRMLLFGGAAVAVSVPCNLLLWQMSGRQLSLLWMLCLSFSSLFLYGALTLGCQRLSLRLSALVPPLVWVGLGMIPLVWSPAAVWLEGVPALVFLLLAAGGLGAFLWQLDRFISHPTEGGRYHAVC